MTMRILWAALLVSQGIYLGLVVGQVIPPPEEPPEPVLLTGLSAAAMFSAVLSILLPRMFYRQALAGPQFAHAEGMAQGPDGVLGVALRLAFAPFIIGCALAESVAIYGLILGLIGFSLLTVAPFFAAGAMLMLVQFPTEGRFRGPMEEALAARRG